MKHLLALLLAACCLLLWSGDALAAPEITSTEPPSFRADDPPRLIIVHGTGFVPPGTRWDQVAAVSQAYTRCNVTGPWTRAGIMIPSTRGWSDKQLTLDVPYIGPCEGFLQVKMVVNGVESTPRGMAILPVPPAAVPKITAISPAARKVGDSQWIIVLKGTGIDWSTYPRFQNQTISSCYRELTNGKLNFYVPEQYRTKPARYFVQLQNDKGYSNIVFFDVVPKAR